jgi:hypothetical protein
MIEDYDRTLELTQIAEDSAGTGAEQLARSQESIETALNKLKSSWQEFYTNFLQGDTFKSIISGANKFVNWLNNGNTMLKTTLTVTTAILGVYTAKHLITALELKVMKSIGGEEAIQKAAEDGILGTEVARLATLKKITAEKKIQNASDEKSSIMDSAKNFFQNKKYKGQGITDILKQGFGRGKSFGEGATETLVEGTESAVKGIKTLGSGLGTGLSNILGGVTEGVGALGGAFVELLPVIGVALPAAIAVGSVAWVTFGKDLYENYKLSKKAEQAIEDLQEATDNYSTSLSEYQDVNEKYNEYLELVAKGTALTTDEVEELTEVQNELASLMPNMVDYYDAEGNAILKENEALADLVETKKEQMLTDQQIKEAATRYGATVGVLSTSTAAGTSFQSMVDSASGLSASNYQKFTTVGSGLSDKEVSEGLEELSNATAFNAVTLGKLTDDTVTTEQFNKIAEAIQEAGEDKEGTEKAEAERKAFRQALEDSNEYSEEKINYLVQLNTDLGNQLVDTFSNLGDYIKEVKIQEAKVDISNVMDAADASEYTNVTEALQTITENQYEEGNSIINQSLEDAKGQLYNRSITLSRNTGGITPHDGVREAEEGERGYSSKEMADLVNTYLGSTDSLEEDVDAFKEGNKQEYQALKSAIKAGEVAVDGNKATSVKDYFEKLQDYQEEYTKQSEQFAEDFGELTDNQQTRINEILGQVKEGTLNDKDAREQLEKILKAANITSKDTIWKQLLGDGEGEAKLDIVANLEIEEKDAIEEQLANMLNAYKNDNGTYQIKIAANLDLSVNEDGEVANLDEFLNKYDITSTQVTAIQDIASGLYSDYGQQAGLNFINAYFDVLGNYKADDQQEIATAINTYINAESVENLRAAEKELKMLGVDISDITDLYTKSGKAGQLGFSGVQDAAEKLSTTLESIDTIMEDIVDAFTGELDITGVSALLNNFDNIDIEDFSVGAEGFKLNKNLDFDSYLDSMLDVYTEQTGQAMAQNAQSFLDQNAANVKIGYTELTAAAQEYVNSSTAEQEKIIEKWADTLDLSVDQVQTYFDGYSDQYQSLLMAALAKEQKAIQERVELAEEEKETWEDIASLIESFEKYYNFDQLADVLELQASDYEATISAAINSNITKQATEDMFNNYTQQMAEQLSDYQTAQKDTNYWKKQINNSKYLSIGEDGNLIKTQEYYNLANKVTSGQATDNEIEYYETIKENIDNMADQYTEAYSRMMKAHTSYINSLKKVKDAIKQEYQYVATMESKILDILEANDQKELDDYQETIDKKKEALQDYLSAVQDAIDKERNMRDTADQEEDLRQKERKLSILQMDTSGMYAGDIASLQKEIANDRQSLQDTYVDNYIDSLSDQINNLSESYDSDITAWEEYLEWKKEDMVQYQEAIDEILSMSLEQQSTWYQKNSEDFLTATDANKKVLLTDFEETAASANSAATLIKEGGLDMLQAALDSLEKDGVNSVDEAIQTFAENATTSIAGEDDTSITSAVKTLNNELDVSVTTLNESLKTAWDGVTSAAQNYLDVLESIGDIDIDSLIAKIKGAIEDSTVKTNDDDVVKPDSIKTLSKEKNSGNIELWENSEVSTTDGKTWVAANLGGKIWYLDKSKLKRGMWGMYTLTDDTEGYNTGKNWWAYKDTDKVKALFPAYARGGYVDYTGPAWVDGTKTSPEAFLDSTDTANIASLVEALQYFSTNKQANLDNSNLISNPTTAQNSYEITINVDELGDGYTVDDLVEEVGNKIYNISTQNKITRV